MTRKFMLENTAQSLEQRLGSLQPKILRKRSLKQKTSPKIPRKGS
jgi:hypothetical protein